MLVSLVFSALYLHQQVNFFYSGPLDSLLAPGKKAGRSDTGIPVDITLTNGGANISPTDFNLKIPNSDQTIKLALTDSKFQTEHFKTTVSVTDSAKTSIEGVRFDVTGATETYTDKGKTLSRSQPVTVASPLFFGDLGPSEQSDALSIDASGIQFTPATTQVVVHAKLSGLLYLTTYHFNRASAGELDVNAKSQIFMSSTWGNSVYRMEGDGSNPVAIAKFPDQTLGMAVNKKTGQIAANYGNHQALVLLNPDGSQQLDIPGSDIIRGWPKYQRFDPLGRLWSTFDSTIVRVGADHKMAAKITNIGGEDTEGGEPFDVAADGSVCAVTDHDFLLLSGTTHQGSKIVGGVKGLGLVMDPASCRFDGRGNIYVTELGDNTTANPPRVSVFDMNGNLVRVFGRGAKEPKPRYPDEYWDSQVYKPFDIAFGPDGKVYIDFSSQDAPIAVFQTF